MRHKYAPGSLLGSWVPSPLVGEGQEEGASGRSAAYGPLSLALSHEGTGKTRTEPPRPVTGGVIMTFGT